MIDKYKRPLFFTFVGLLAFYLLLVLFNLFFNYGSINVSGIKEGAVATINGKVLDGTTSKLKPGQYSVIVTNKDLSTFYKSVEVNRFSSNTVEVTQNQLSLSDKVSKALGYNPEYVNEADLIDIKYFENGSVIAGNLSQGSYALFVLRYDNGWKPEYFQSSGYQSNLDLITNQEARSYIQSLQTRYSNAN